MLPWGTVFGTPRRRIAQDASGERRPARSSWQWLGAALLHESELARTDPDPQFLHRPMRYDIGLPSPVI